MRQHLQLAERRFKRQDPRLHQRCPRGREHIWGWYLDLRSGLPGDAALSYGELAAWREMSGEEPTPGEVADLRAMDVVYLEVLRKVRKYG